MKPCMLGSVLAEAAPLPYERLKKSKHIPNAHGDYHVEVRGAARSLGGIVRADGSADHEARMRLCPRKCLLEDLAAN